MSRSGHQGGSRALRIALVGITGFIASPTFVGGAGLASGHRAFVGDAMTARQPHSSPIGPACVLVARVGIPTAVTAVMAVVNDARTAPAAFVSGILLITWVAIQVPVIGYAHWLHAVSVALGHCVACFRFRLRQYIGPVR